MHGLYENNPTVSLSLSLSVSLSLSLSLLRLYHGSSFHQQFYFYSLLIFEFSPFNLGPQALPSSVNLPYRLQRSFVTPLPLPSNLHRHVFCQLPRHFHAAALSASGKTWFSFHACFSLSTLVFLFPCLFFSFRAFSTFSIHALLFPCAFLSFHVCSSFSAFFLLFPHSFPACFLYFSLKFVFWFLLNNILILYRTC